MQAHEPAISGENEFFDGLLDQLELDVGLTMRAIAQASDEVRVKTNETLHVMAGVSSASSELSDLSATAFEATTLLADDTRQLEVTSTAIEAHLEGTDAFVADAQELASDVTVRMGELTAAVERIAGMVAVIGGIARRTNLLALNASIEAARAGTAGLGFAVVATEVKALAGQVQTATADISGQIVRLQRVAGESGSSVANIARLLERVEPVLESVRDAVHTQISGAREVAARAGDSLQFVSVVSQKTEAMSRMTQAASASSLTAGQSAEAMAPAVRRLSERSTGVLRQAGSRERRSAPREPGRISGHLIQPGRQPIRVETRDLSIKGALLHIEAPEAWTGSPAELDLQGVGLVPVQFRRVTDEGTIIAFRPEPSPSMRSRLAELVAANREANQSHVQQLTGAAAELSAMLNEAVSRGTVDINTLITVDYQRIPGTEPTQYATGALPFYERVLPEFLVRSSSAIEGSLFMKASDRNGYVPVHPPVSPDLSNTGRLEWDRSCFRNRQLFDHPRILMAARNQAASMVSVYLLPQTDRAPLCVKLVAVPVLVSGRLWGNLITFLPL